MEQSYINKLRVWKKAYDISENKNLLIINNINKANSNGHEIEFRHFQKEQFMNNIERETIKRNLIRLLNTNKSIGTNKIINYLNKNFDLEEEKYNLYVLKEQLQLNKLEESLIIDNINKCNSNCNKLLDDLKKNLSDNKRLRKDINSKINKLESKVNQFNKSFDEYIKRIAK